MPVSASSTGSSFTVLSTTDLKTHLRVTDTNSDSYIGALADVAISLVEAQTGRSLGSRKYTWTMDGFPCQSYLYVPKPPLQSVTSITYIDTDESTQTWGSTYYTVDTNSVPARISPAYQESWPINLNIPNSVTITFTAGYGSSSQVPAALLHAAKFIGAHLWTNRQDVVMGNGFQTAVTIPQNSSWLLAPYQVPFFEGY
jgi:uncharacterized phiE125 gp8 family phage protein